MASYSFFMRAKVKQGRSLDGGAEESPLPRKTRVDAERNRESLVDAGKEVFANSGASASLEEIARRAGVGIGTLYRHFPTRDALIEGVYRRELEYLADSARQLDGVLAPGEALDKWMRLFVDYIATKKVLASALSSTIGVASDLAASSRVQILDAITFLIHRAAAAGDIRSDIEPLDLLRALAGFTYGAIGPEWEPSANRMIDLLMDGLRSRS